MKTAITEMVGVKYPIICGAMMWISKPTLCAAISNAGGLGNLTAGNYETGCSSMIISRSMCAAPSSRGA